MGTGSGASRAAVPTEQYSPVPVPVFPRPLTFGLRARPASARIRSGVEPPHARKGRRIRPYHASPMAPTIWRASRWEAAYWAISWVSPISRAGT